MEQVVSRLKLAQLNSTAAHHHAFMRMAAHWHQIAKECDGQVRAWIQWCQKKLGSARYGHSADPSHNISRLCVALRFLVSPGTIRKTDGGLVDTGRRPCAGRLANSVGLIGPIFHILARIFHLPAGIRSVP